MLKGLGGDCGKGFLELCLRGNGLIKCKKENFALLVSGRGDDDGYLEIGVSLLFFGVCIFNYKSGLRGVRSLTFF